MADMLASGASWLAGQLSASASRSFAYFRGANVGTIKAAVGVSRFESQNTSGVVETWESRDFILPASSLPFGDPARHDRIVETIGGISVTYEVTSPRGVPVFHYGDAFRQTVRIHTIASSEQATSFHGNPVGDSR